MHFELIQFYSLKIYHDKKSKEKGERALARQRGKRCFIQHLTLLISVSTYPARLGQVRARSQELHPDLSQGAGRDPCPQDLPIRICSYRKLDPKQRSWKPKPRLSDLSNVGVPCSNPTPYAATPAPIYIVLHRAKIYDVNLEAIWFMEKFTELILVS